MVKDCWIPSNTGFRVLGQVRGLANDAKVSQLIDNDLGNWNSELIFNTFDEEEAKQIVSIPFSRRNIVDKQI